MCQLYNMSFEINVVKVRTTSWNLIKHKKCTNIFVKKNEKNTTYEILHLSICKANAFPLLISAYLNTFEPPTGCIFLHKFPIHPLFMGTLFGIHCGAASKLKKQAKIRPVFWQFFFGPKYGLLFIIWFSRQTNKRKANATLQHLFINSFVEFVWTILR